MYKLAFQNIAYFCGKLTKRAEVVIFRFRQYCMDTLLFMKMKIYPLIGVVYVLGMVVDHNRIFIIGMQYDWVCQLQEDRHWRRGVTILVNVTHGNIKVE